MAIMIVNIGKNVVVNSMVMIMKFKVGDKVIVIANIDYNNINYSGATGTITKARNPDSSKYPYDVTFDTPFKVNDGWLKEWDNFNAKEIEHLRIDFNEVI